MNLDLSQDHRISLKRHDRKLWSYRDNKPDVVEAAVLDYLRDNGFDGYFTQRDNYISLFKRLAGWPGKISKRMPPGFVSPDFVYYMGSDGWLSSHKFSYQQVMAEVEATTIKTLTEKLCSFCADKTYSMHSFSDLKQQPEHMLSFLQVFGIERLRHEIKDRFTAESLNARRFLYDFDTRTYSIGFMDSATVSAEGLAKEVKLMTLFQSAFHRSDGFDRNIAYTEDFAHYVKDEALRLEILDVCSFARRWRAKTLESYEITTLDLQIWDESGTAIVEVKAPNDRLMQSQKNTIELARKAGERACLISVDEAN